MAAVESIVRREPPLVTFVTAGSRPGAAANNESRWLGDAFAEMGLRYDALYLEGPPGTKRKGSTREVRLAPCEHDPRSWR